MGFNCLKARATSKAKKREILYASNEKGRGKAHELKNYGIKGNRKNEK